MLVANAPHIPIHLDHERASALCRAKRRKDETGRRVVVNAPYNGGTHLPDVTVITPIFDDAGGNSAVVASAADIANIGGITPGSMPPDSKVVEEEVSCSTTSCWSMAAIFLKTIAKHCRPPVSGAQSGSQRRGPQSADRRGREGRAGSAQDDRTVRTGRRTRLYASRSGQCRAGSPCCRRDAGRRFSYPTDEGAEIKVKISFNKEERPRPLISPGPALNDLRTITHRRRWLVPLFCTCSVVSLTTTSL